MECIRSIDECGSPTIPYEIVLVDDASTENFLFNISPSLQIIRNETNLGFARSCNRGAGCTDSQYLVFLNNDTIVQPGWLDNLVHVIETESEAGIVGSKMLYADDRIQHAGVVFDEENLPFHIYHRFPANFSGVNKIREFQAVTGACFIIRTYLYKALGGFDERFLNGFEDIDLCLRVHQTGQRIYYAPQSCLYHLEAQSRKNVSSKFSPNQVLYLEKWGREVLKDYNIFYQDDFLNEVDLPEPLVRLRNTVKTIDKPLVALWGAGRAGIQLGNMLHFIGIEPNFFIDSDPQKWGNTINGYPVFQPEHLKELKSDEQMIFVFIASLYFKEIIATLIQFGFDPAKEIW